MTSTCVPQRNAALVFSQSPLPSAGNKGDAPPPVDVPLSSERETSSLWFAAAPFGCVKKPGTSRRPSTTAWITSAARQAGACHPSLCRAGPLAVLVPERRNSQVLRVPTGRHPFVSSHSSAPRWPCCASGLVTAWWARRKELGARRVRNQLAEEAAEWPSPRRTPWQPLF